MFGKGSFDPDASSLATKIFGVWIPSVTLTRWGGGIILVIEFIGLLAAIYGCTQATVDFQYKQWFTSPDSWIRDGFNIENKFFFGNQDHVTLYTRFGDYFDNQENMLRCVQDIQSSPYLSKLPPSRSW